MAQICFSFSFADQVLLGFRFFGFSVFRFFGFSVFRFFSAAFRLSAGKGKGWRDAVASIWVGLVDTPTQRVSFLFFTLRYPWWMRWMRCRCWTDFLEFDKFETCWWRSTMPGWQCTKNFKYWSTRTAFMNCFRFGQFLKNLFTFRCDPHWSDF